MIKIAEIQGFVSVKKGLILFALIITSLCYCDAQGDKVIVPTSFEDSVRVVLENTRSLDASVVGAGFFSIWNGLSIDQQMVIKKQTFQMRKKKFPLKSHLVNYFGAIVNAVTIEKADATTLSGYLKVAGKVIEDLPGAKAQNFFARSRIFFEHHALAYDKSFRLYAKEDTYAFEYIAPPPPPSWNDTISTETEPETYPEEPQPLDEIPQDQTRRGSGRARADGKPQAAIRWRP